MAAGVKALGGKRWSRYRSCREADIRAFTVMEHFDGPPMVRLLLLLPASVTDNWGKWSAHSLPSNSPSIYPLRALRIRLAALRLFSR